MGRQKLILRTGKARKRLKVGSKYYKYKKYTNTKSQAKAVCKDLRSKGYSCTFRYMKGTKGYGTYLIYIRKRSR